MNINKKYIRGITLVELLISITIMSLVTTSMFFLFNSVQKKYIQSKTLSDLDSYVKGVFLYLDETISAAVGDSITPLNQNYYGYNAYRLDFANIHNEWYNNNGDFFNDDNCQIEEGCLNYTWPGERCREICTGITIKCNSNEGILFNDKPIWQYIDFRGKPFYKDDPESLSEYEIVDFSIEKISAGVAYDGVGLNANTVSNLKRASYMINLTIGIDNSDGEIIGNEKKNYYNYSHRVFSPTILAMSGS
ncbi:MAG: hypothetical protein CMG64_02180 [Candidatus Marinimicrobia bacterium]|nr:hypothetical protein [Candidatus Neomarinimicrobiota bacterium]|tara:strand:- start:270 stop:1013 length:744 start_codon:yes stop_codon:yes gene_type:complete